MITKNEQKSATADISKTFIMVSTSIPWANKLHNSVSVFIQVSCLSFNNATFSMNSKTYQNCVIT
jgi:hypothetical protein